LEAETISTAVQLCRGTKAEKEDVWHEVY